MFKGRLSRRFTVSTRNTILSFLSLPQACTNARTFGIVGLHKCQNKKLEIFLWSLRLPSLGYDIFCMWYYTMVVHAQCYNESSELPYRSLKNQEQLTRYFIVNQLHLNVGSIMLYSLLIFYSPFNLSKDKKLRQRCSKPILRLPSVYHNK